METNIGEFESNGTGSNIKCSIAYAVPSELTVVYFQWHKEFEEVYALSQDLAFVQTLNSDTEEIDFTITCAEWEECKKRISEQNISVYYC